MADNEMDIDAPEEGAEEEKPKKKSPLMLIIIIVGVLVLGAGGYFGWMFFMAEDEPPPEAEQAAQEEGAGEAKKEKGTEAPQNVLDMDPFIVNLADPTGKRYLKLKLAVDAKDEELKMDLERRMPQIRDSVLLLLTSKTYEDISTVAGKIRLRNEILQIINRSLGGDASVHSVYFTEFVVQ